MHIRTESSSGGIGGEVVSTSNLDELKMESQTAGKPLIATMLPGANQAQAELESQLRDAQAKVASLAAELREQAHLSDTHHLGWTREKEEMAEEIGRMRAEKAQLQELNEKHKEELENARASYNELSNLYEAEEKRSQASAKLVQQLRVQLEEAQSRMKTPRYVALKSSCDSALSQSFVDPEVLRKTTSVSHLHVPATTKTGRLSAVQQPQTQRESKQQPKTKAGMFFNPLSTLFP